MLQRVPHHTVGAAYVTLGSESNGEVRGGAMAAFGARMCRSRTWPAAS